MEKKKGIIDKAIDKFRNKGSVSDIINHLKKKGVSVTERLIKKRISNS